jgi:hypothetical protein
MLWLLLKQSKNITNRRCHIDLRTQVIKHLKTELGSPDKVKDFSNLLRSLNICDLRDDLDLKAVATTGAIDNLIALYMMGVLNKLSQIKEIINQEK